MIVYTQGTFDLFHTGHVNLFRRCRKLSNNGTVIVALLSDKAVKSYRGVGPVLSFAERKAMLESCVYVDKVIESDHRHTKEEINRIKPDWVVVGTDWVAKNIYKQYGVNKKWLDQWLVFFPYTDDISTTAIKRRITNNEKRSV